MYIYVYVGIIVPRFLETGWLVCSVGAAELSTHFAAGCLSKWRTSNNLPLHPHTFFIAPITIFSMVRIKWIWELISILNSILFIFHFTKISIPLDLTFRCEVLIALCIPCGLAPVQIIAWCLSEAPPDESCFWIGYGHGHGHGTASIAISVITMGKS